MPRKITKEHALKIIKKLGAEVATKRSAHDLVQVYHQGILVTTFGLRRGSSKDLPHNFIPADLSLTHRQTLDLANCPLSYDAWVAIMQQKGIVE